MLVYAIGGGRATLLGVVFVMEVAGEPGRPRRRDHLLARAQPVHLATAMGLASSRRTAGAAFSVNLTSTEMMPSGWSTPRWAVRRGLDEKWVRLPRRARAGRRAGLRLRDAVRLAGMSSPRPVLVVDYGAQYAQLIARRVREHYCYCEIVPASVYPARLKGAKGIILTGGPASVYGRARCRSTRRCSRPEYRCSASATGSRRWRSPSAVPPGTPVNASSGTAVAVRPEAGVLFAACRRSWTPG
jgi:hypothetical protein